MTFVNTYCDILKIMKLTLAAPAKINILLKVTGRRDDGYHELASVFQMIDLYDILTIESATTGAITVTSDTSEIPDGEDNLVYQAAMALKKFSGAKAGAKISLSKNIPVAAGLGGGSSDAASTLMGLNKLWNTGLDRNELIDIGKTIGSDVPFFLGSAAAWVTGAGEFLEPINVSHPISLLLVKPAFGISAQDAYTGSDFSLEPFEKKQALIADIESGDPAKVAKHLVNDLENWAIKTHPELIMLKEKIEKTYPVGVLMSGSGPTFFALYEDENKLEKAARALDGHASFVCPAKTLLVAGEGGEG